jgi:VanZ family protein
VIRLPRWLVLTGFWVPLAGATYAAFAPHGVPMPFRISDIVLHAAAFTYLTAALCFAYFANGAWWQSTPWMIAYGIFIEVVQSFEPTRDAELKDIAVDVVGIALGLALYRFVVTRWRIATY